MFDLSGKVALVTGAASGIGLETSRTLTGLGATVIITDRNVEALVEVSENLLPGAIALALDVTAQGDWDRVYQSVADKFGCLDILVNNAGIMKAEPFEKCDIDTFRLQQRINVEGVYMGMQGAIPLMRKALAEGKGSASIVNISSIYATNAGAEFAAYTATKAAVLGLSKAVAFELAGTGIRVNCVLPGPIATNLSADWEPLRDSEGNVLSLEEQLAPWVDKIPMGRIGMADDVAPVIAFLASDAAKFVTGSEYVVDGGYTAP
ncbi:SDR family oxidoreductase [Halioxenophilus sp. WMMB6]|uniref:SDR family NAD(P)-dependent oxidoreductase n=1 Tax=Halioxenophilus sp. WMMB6 TaxID=3073815 RepID=UPI00295EFE77|nr:SDR family oxidoreductase [Halioxenophilus sp. WMMB6]